MTLFDGMVPLIAIVEITLLLELLISFIFFLIFLIIHSKVWYLMLPLPLAEIITAVIVIYDPFQRVNNLFLVLKCAMALLYLASAVVFQAFSRYLID